MTTPTPKKSLGQHWLEDEASLDAMVAAVAVDGDDTVLEIGPGLGALTAKLTAAAKQVIAVEFDAVLAQTLAQRVSARNLEVIQQDILHFDLTSLPAGYKVVANIPYYLTSNLIRVLSETINPPAAAAILVQKEVAERVAAKPGQLSLLSVTAQFYWNVSLGTVVGAELFTPPPKVDSQIVIMKRQQGTRFPAADPKLFFRLAKAGFSERRKTLRNSLSGGLHLTKEQAETLLRRAGLEPQLRAQNLTLDQWNKLYEQCIAAGIYH